MGGTRDVRRVRVSVAGRVQGVFFRVACAERARAAGVGGFVRNLRDGRVEATFEGSADAVDEMIAWCRRGPDGARVDGVEVADERPAGDRTFHITG